MKYVVAVLATLTAACAAIAEEPITVFEAKRIVTMEPAWPEAKYVAVRDGLVLGVGNDLDDLSAWLGGRDYTLDEQFRDHVLMPGFVDPHLHPLMAAVLLPTEFVTPEGWSLPEGDSPPVRTAERYQTRLAEAIAAHNSEAPFITWGYHQLWHGPMDRAILDAIESDTPVFVWHRSFHEIIANSAGMNYLGYASEDAFNIAIARPGIDPAHADFSTGHFSETALGIALPGLQRVILSPAYLQLGFETIQRMMLQNGVTTIADMATGIFAPFETESAMIRRAFDRPDAPARVLLVPEARLLAERKGSIEAALDFLKTLETPPGNGRVFLNNRVKLFSDGAFFSQYMRMNPPGYTDGHEGKWLTEPEELRTLAKAFWNAGYTLHCHVNGDAGVDVVLDILEDLQAQHASPDHRFTLEHYGYSTEAQNRRVKALGALVSAQPNYVYVLSEAYAEAGLGRDRASQMSRLGSLERLGVPVALHSDLTMAPVDPLFLAWIAANRENMEGNVVAPEERLSLDKALRAITIDAAYILGLEHQIGSIAAGKKADFAVLERDPYAVGTAKLDQIDVWGVVFEGEVYPAQ